MTTPYYTGDQIENQEHDASTGAKVVELIGVNDQQGTSYPTTDLKVTNQSPATHVTFNPSESFVTVLNRNPYCGLTAQVNGAGFQHKIPAGGVLTLRGQDISSLDLQALAAPCMVQVKAGMDHDVTPTPRKSRAEYFMIPTYHIQYVIGTTYFATKSGLDVWMATGDITVTGTSTVPSWTKLGALTLASGDYIGNMIVNTNGILLVFTSKGRIFRCDTTQGTYTFTETTPSLTPAMNEPYWHGIDFHGNTCVFGEYSTSATTMRLITSTDGGQTWTATLTETGGTSGYIRHWHSVNYHQSQNKWLATSGDGYGQVRWFSSPDGSTWTEEPYVKMLATNNDPKGTKYRTLNVLEYDAESIMWASDSGAYSAQKGVYKAAYGDPSSAVMLFRLPHAAWGFAMDGNRIVVICATEGGELEAMASVFVSEDGGVTWNQDLTWKAAQSNITGSHPYGVVNDGGFFAIFGPDAYGRFYINLNNMDSSTPITVCVSFDQGGYDS